jgi:DnaJ-class molecular chaperone
LYSPQTTDLVELGKERMEKIYRKCQRCLGTGIAHMGGTTPAEDPCVWCSGTGFVDTGDTLDGSTLDAIKAMLDSTAYGMQKMSSNLDDIMVKLDV